MMMTEIVAGRPVEIETAEIEPVRVRVLPNGNMDSNNAAKYVGRAPKTLAMWRMQGVGPEWTKNGGRVFYNKEASYRLFQPGTGAPRIMENTS